MLIHETASIHAAGKQEEQELKEALERRLTEVGIVFEALFAQINVSVWSDGS